jgi:hypothetical protein
MDGSSKGLISGRSPGGISLMNQNQPLINDDSSEDLHNYMKSRRGSDKFNNESSGDSVSSDGSDSENSPDNKKNDD